MKLQIISDLHFEFDILDWNKLLGTFDDINLPELREGLAWNLDSLYADGNLTVGVDNITVGSY